MRRTLLAVALGMGLMSALCACGNRESEGNALEMIGSESTEANIGNQSVRNSSQIDQTEQEAAMEAGYETREIHVDKEGMDIYGVVHIPSGTEGKMPTVIMSLEAVLKEVKQRDFVDIWDQEPYERIKEYGKNILLIHGDRDSIVPVSYSDKLAETIDHVEYHVIQGADHGCQ